MRVRTARRFDHDPSEVELVDAGDSISLKECKEMQLPVELRTQQLGHAFFELSELIRYWRINNIDGRRRGASYTKFICPNTREIVYWDQVEAISWPGHDNDGAVAMRIAQRDLEEIDEDEWLRIFHMQYAHATKEQIQAAIVKEKHAALVRIHVGSNEFHRKLRKKLLTFQVMDGVDTWMINHGSESDWDKRIIFAESVLFGAAVGLSFLEWRNVLEIPPKRRLDHYLRCINTTFSLT